MARKKILVVEDDRLNAKFFGLTLRRCSGHEVEVNEVVDQILERVRSGQIDLVIMDVSLSRSSYKGQPVDGVAICKLLKADDRTRHIPVLLATAHAMSGNRDVLLRESGADGYISKPIQDPSELVNKVTDLLSGKR